MPCTKYCIAVFLISPAFAQQLQNRPPVLQLSLKQAVEIALAPEGNTRVRLAEEALKQSETQSNQSRAALLPDFESYVQYQNETNNIKAFGFNFSSFIPPIPGLNLNFPSLLGPFSILDVRANVNQSIFDFSSLRRYQASKVAIQATKAENDGTRDQVTDQVARAYLAALRAQAALDTARANVELSEALLRLAQSQKAAGTGTGIEITRAQVQLANDRQLALVAENDLDRARLQLLKVVGLRLDNPVELTAKLEYVQMESMNEAQALAIAQEHRAELKAQRRREDHARLNYSATRMERLPTLAAFANYGDLGSGLTNALPTRSVGFTAKIPLFDGGRRDARRAESASLYRQEKIRTVDLHDQIELEVREALDGMRSADAQVKTAEEGLMLAENEVAQAERRYRAGVTNSIEVTDAQTRLARARDNRINALYNYNLARIDLGTATGTIQSMIQ
ncbi:MAG TPA: TolC family protein [Bryobacteraceae bacterium]|nr:TolC family protein [Bryobacteraceae bacterium]